MQGDHTARLRAGLDAYWAAHGGTRGRDMMFHGPFLNQLNYTVFVTAADGLIAFLDDSWQRTFRGADRVTEAVTGVPKYTPVTVHLPRGVTERVVYEKFYATYIWYYARSRNPDWRAQPDTYPPGFDLATITDMWVDYMDQSHVYDPDQFFTNAPEDTNEDILAAIMALPQVTAARAREIANETMKDVVKYMDEETFLAQYKGLFRPNQRGVLESIVSWAREPVLLTLTPTGANVDIGLGRVPIEGARLATDGYLYNYISLLLLESNTQTIGPEILKIYRDEDMKIAEARSLAELDEMFPNWVIEELGFFSSQVPAIVNTRRIPLGLHTLLRFFKQVAILEPEDYDISANPFDLELFRQKVKEEMVFPFVDQVAHDTFSPNNDIRMDDTASLVDITRLNEQRAPATREQFLTRMMTFIAPHRLKARSIIARRNAFLSPMTGKLEHYSMTPFDAELIKILKAAEIYLNRMPASSAPPQESRRGRISFKELKKAAKPSVPALKKEVPLVAAAAPVDLAQAMGLEIQKPAQAAPQQMGGSEQKAGAITKYVIQPQTAERIPIAAGCTPQVAKLITEKVVKLARPIVKMIDQNPDLYKTLTEWEVARNRQPLVGPQEAPTAATSVIVSSGTATTALLELNLVTLSGCVTVPPFGKPLDVGRMIYGNRLGGVYDAKTYEISEPTQVEAFRPSQAIIVPIFKTDENKRLFEFIAYVTAQEIAGEARVSYMPDYKWVCTGDDVARLWYPERAVGVHVGIMAYSSVGVVTLREWVTKELEQMVDVAQTNQRETKDDKEERLAPVAAQLIAAINRIYELLDVLVLNLARTVATQKVPMWPVGDLDCSYDVVLNQMTRVPALLLKTNWIPSDLETFDEILHDCQAIKSDFNAILPPHARLIGMENKAIYGSLLDRILGKNPALANPENAWAFAFQYVVKRFRLDVWLLLKDSVIRMAASHTVAEMRATLLAVVENIDFMLINPDKF